MKNFNEKAHYPFTYGDTNVDKIMLSDRVVKLVKTKRFRSHMTAVFFALLSVVSYPRGSSAIPPEYGEAAAEAIKGAGQAAQPMAGDFAGKVNINQQLPQNLPEGGNLIPPNLGHLGQAGNVGFNQGNPGGFGPHLNQNGIPNANRPPVPGNAWRLPGPPQGAVGQYTNTLFLIGSVGWICLNASWGSPIFAYGCVGIVGGILNELRKKCM